MVLKRKDASPRERKWLPLAHKQARQCVKETQASTHLHSTAFLLGLTPSVCFSLQHNSSWWSPAAYLLTFYRLETGGELGLRGDALPNVMQLGAVGGVPSQLSAHFLWVPRVGAGIACE